MIYVDAKKQKGKRPLLYTLDSVILTGASILYGQAAEVTGKWRLYSLNIRPKFIRSRFIRSVSPKRSEKELQLQY